MKSDTLRSSNANQNMRNVITKFEKKINNIMSKPRRGRHALDDVEKEIKDVLNLICNADLNSVSTRIPFVWHTSETVRLLLVVHGKFY